VTFPNMAQPTMARVQAVRWNTGTPAEAAPQLVSRPFVVPRLTKFASQGVESAAEAGVEGVFQPCRDHACSAATTSKSGSHR
jgi:hypothetical protein